MAKKLDKNASNKSNNNAQNNNQNSYMNGNDPESSVNHRNGASNKKGGQDCGNCR